MTLPIPIPVPDGLIPRDICPHCREGTHCYRFMTPDGHWLETHHCHSHGDVAPLRSVVVSQRLMAELLPA